MEAWAGVTRRQIFGSHSQVISRERVSLRRGATELHKSRGWPRHTARRHLRSAWRARRILRETGSFRTTKALKHGGELTKSEEGGAQFLLSGRDTPELLQPFEEALDVVALTTGGFLPAERLLPVGFVGKCWGSHLDHGCRHEHDRHHSLGRR